jgi:hypothetical protein
LLALTMIAAACTQQTDTASARVKPTSKYQEPKEAGPTDAGIGPLPDIDLPSLDGSLFGDLQMGVKTIPQALSVILTGYDIDESEGNYGKANASTPPLMAYSNDLLKDIQEARTRLHALYTAKEVTPQSNNVSDQMKFQSQAAQMQLTGVFGNGGFDPAKFAARRTQAESSFLGIIEKQLQPVMETDDDFKAEIARIHEDVSRREARATALQNGVQNGTADGMFDQMDPVLGPNLGAGAAPQQAPKPTPKPEGDGGA